MDYGGPRREFLRLLASDAAQSLLVGNYAMKFFYLDSTAFKVCVAYVKVYSPLKKNLLVWLIGILQLKSYLYFADKKKLNTLLSKGSKSNWQELCCEDL